jgi:WD40 repeat protein
VSLWNAETGEKIRTFRGHAARVKGACISNDRKWLFTGSEDGTVRIWDLNSGKEMASIMSLDAGKDWLVLTRDGRFDASSGAIKYVSYRVAGTLDFVPLEKVRSSFERPGLLAKIMNGEK